MLPPFPHGMRARSFCWRAISLEVCKDKSRLVLSAFKQALPGWSPDLVTLHIHLEHEALLLMYRLVRSGHSAQGECNRMKVSMWRRSGCRSSRGCPATLTLASCVTRDVTDTYCQLRPLTHGQEDPCSCKSAGTGQRCSTCCTGLW